MSLSFADSLKNNANAAIANENIEAASIASVADINEIAINNIAIEDNLIMTIDENHGIAAYAGDDGNWHQHPDYVHYSFFSDNNISSIPSNGHSIPTSGSFHNKPLSYSGA